VLPYAAAALTSSLDEHCAFSQQLEHPLRRHLVLSNGGPWRNPLIRAFATQ